MALPFAKWESAALAMKKQGKMLVRKARSHGPAEIPTLAVEPAVAAVLVLLLRHLSPSLSLYTDWRVVRSCLGLKALLFLARLDRYCRV